MAVYLDTARLRFGRMTMCHMIADSEQELHAMALTIGMKREWFQADASTPHYDVCLSRKKLAIKAGAIVLERRDFVAVIRRLREGST